jgi:hypothetical protein
MADIAAMIDADQVPIRQPAGFKLIHYIVEEVAAAPHSRRSRAEQAENTEPAVMDYLPLPLAPDEKPPTVRISGQ